MPCLQPPQPQNGALHFAAYDSSCQKFACECAVCCKRLSATLWSTDVHLQTPVSSSVMPPPSTIVRVCGWQTLLHPCTCEQLRCRLVSSNIPKAVNFFKFCISDRSAVLLSRYLWAHLYK